MKKLVFCLLVAAPLSAPAVANPVDNYAANAIQAADFATAETQLNARLQRVPMDRVALINLAHVYRQTARAREADKLYARVLDRSDIQLETTAGAPVWSHDVARAGLRGAVSVAMR